MSERTWGFKSPLRHPPRFHLDIDAAFGVIGEIHSEFWVKLCLVVRVGFGEHRDDVLQRLDESPHLWSGELVAGDFAPWTSRSCRSR